MRVLLRDQNVLVQNKSKFIHIIDCLGIYQHFGLEAELNWLSNSRVLLLTITVIVNITIGASYVVSLHKTCN